MVGTSIGPALAISMQENPPAATARPADIFRASRRLMFGMGVLSAVGLQSGGFVPFIK